MQPLMHFQSICQIERQLASLAGETRWGDAKVVDVRPLFQQTTFTRDALSAVLPEQMLLNVRLVAISYAATIAQMMQFVLPHVIR